MEASYKHSYKTGENLLNSLSVYNVGYQKCDPEYQWGPGVRDHYCIHHILSGQRMLLYERNCVKVFGRRRYVYSLSGRRAYGIRQMRHKPWEYAWAGFMGADAASLIRNTEFSRETPYILNGRIPTEKIRDGLERIYNAKGNTYEAAVAMTGEMYSLLAVFMHYAEHEEKAKAIQLTYAEKAENVYRNKLFISYYGRRDCFLCWDKQKPFVSFFSKLYEQIAERIFDGIQDQAGTCRLLRETDLSVSAIAYSVGFENNLYFSKAFRKQKGESPSEYRKSRVRKI